MNRPRIAKLTEEIALMRNSYEFMEELELSWKEFIEGVSNFDNMVNSDIPLPFIPLLKLIPTDPINKVKSSNIRRGNSIVFPVS